MKGKGKGPWGGGGMKKRRGEIGGGKEGEGMVEGVLRDKVRRIWKNENNYLRRMERANNAKCQRVHERILIYITCVTY